MSKEQFVEKYEIYFNLSINLTTECLRNRMT